MKVKLRCSRSGIGFSQHAGDVIDVCDDEGLRMIEADQAEASNSEGVSVANGETTADGDQNETIPTAKKLPRKASKNE